jgi:hypothetical protein
LSMDESSKMCECYKFINAANVGKFTPPAAGSKDQNFTSSVP